MEIETDMLLWTIHGLLEQARAEPDKADSCINMIRTTINNVRMRRCEVCSKPFKKHHKFKPSGQGFSHLHCNWPSSYLSEKQFIKTFGEEVYNKQRK